MAQVETTPKLIVYERGLGLSRRYFVGCPNPRRAYDADGREIPPMTLANMREHGVRSVAAHCRKRHLVPYAFSPGGRYVIEDAFCMAATVSSTVSKTVVCNELRAPPELIAIAVAAIETLSGASHKL